MTLDYSIDRADFRRLVDVALRRIPTASRGNWTLHAPVDPGITLAELFAWLLEQRSYWADRTTAPLVRAVMAMFGDAIREARPSGVAITFEPELADPQVANAQVSRRTTLRVPETDLVFTLRHGLTALALARDAGVPIIELDGVAGYHGEDLRGGRPIPLLPAPAGAVSARIGIALAQPPPASAALPVSILVELDTGVAPQWHPGAADARPAADVRWDYQDGGGTWKPLPALHDGTLGLRRSGIVRFALPADWSAYGPDRVGWLRVGTSRSTFSSPPTVVRIAPNTAIATHHEWRRYAGDPGWLPLPARTIQLAGHPLADRVFVVIAEPAGKRRWRIQPDLAHAGPADRVATLDRERARVVFGDGIAGRVPRLDGAVSPQVIVHYAVGGGAAGNLPPSAWETVTGTLPGARSHVPAIGGRDAETLDAARTRASSGLRTPTRAVTPDDHETVARATPGVDVARAHAEVGFVLGECGVVPGVTTVFVVPGITSRTHELVRDGVAVAAPPADPGLLAEVRAQLERARLVGEAIVVEPAAYRHVRLRATVAGAPYDRAGLRRALAGELRVFLDPLLGGDGGGWPFGDPIRPTALLGVAQRAAGDRGDVVAVAIAIDDRPFEACEDVAIRPYELVAVDGVEVVIADTPTAEVGLR